MIAAKSNVEPILDEVLTGDEAARYLKVCRKELDQMIKDGLFPYFKVRRIVRVRKADLDRLFK